MKSGEWTTLARARDSDEADIRAAEEVLRAATIWRCAPGGRTSTRSPDGQDRRVQPLGEDRRDRLSCECSDDLHDRGADIGGGVMRYGVQPLRRTAVLAGRLRWKNASDLECR